MSLTPEQKTTDEVIVTVVLVLVDVGGLYS
jgi:hypothetical protein